VPVHKASFLALWTANRWVSKLLKMWSLVVVKIARTEKRNEMAAKNTKKSKNTKSLKKAKKLEATKPLATMVEYKQ
jgi:hypothetical protein